MRLELTERYNGAKEMLMKDEFGNVRVYIPETVKWIIYNRPDAAYTATEYRTGKFVVSEAGLVRAPEWFADKSLELLGEISEDSGGYSQPLGVTSDNVRGDAP